MRVLTVRLIIEKVTYPEDPNVVPWPVIDRRLSFPITLIPLVKTIRWWNNHLRERGYLKPNERIIGFIPEKIGPVVERSIP